MQPLYIIVNGRVLPPCDTVLGSVCQLTCDDSYIMEGPEQITCQKTDDIVEWSNPGTCKKIAIGNTLVVFLYGIQLAHIVHVVTINVAHIIYILNVYLAIYIEILECILNALVRQLFHYKIRCNFRPICLSGR